MSEQLCQVSEVSEVTSHLSGGQTLIRHFVFMTEDPSRGGNRVEVTSRSHDPRGIAEAVVPEVPQGEAPGLSELERPSSDGTVSIDP